MDCPVNQAQRPCILLHCINIYIYIYIPPSHIIAYRPMHTAILHIYIEGRWTPQSIEHRGLAYRYIAYIYIEREGRWTPQSIEHRGLAYHYTAYICRERREMDPPVNSA